MENLAVTVREAREALSFGSTKLYELIRAGELSAFKIGRRTLITRESIVSLVERRSKQGAAS